MSKTALVFGGTGLLGSEFSRLFSKNYEIVSYGSKEANVSELDQVRSAIVKHTPDIVINCAAIANVDKCEENRELAYAVNVTGAENIAVVCKEKDVLLIHISTDYLFDGKSNLPYKENDKINPINYYGMTKMLAEKIINDVGGRRIILRVAWLYSNNEDTFVYKIIQQGVAHLVKKGHGEEYETVKVVTDQIGTPTLTSDVVRQAEKIIDSGLAGTFHCTAEGETSRYEMARLIFDHLSMPVETEEIESDKFNWIAPRPRYTVLENEALNNAGINIMPHYEEALKRFIDQMESE